MLGFGILAVVAVDTVAINSLLSVTKRGGSNASILYEMPCQKRNEEHQKHNHEEPQAGYSRRMSRMWHEDVQNR
jgi:hypothetical protein